MEVRTNTHNAHTLAKTTETKTKEEEEEEVIVVVGRKNSARNQMACAAPIDTQNATTSTTTGNGSSSNTAVVQRQPRMEGVGARVIRGPDWKWGKQVRPIVSTMSVQKKK